MKDATLVIMAAGIGSRYGGGIKQLEKVGPGGEIIMDYSIYDAKKAGFNKVVFIIRKDLEKDFKEIIGNRIEKEINVAYAYQELSNLPAGFVVPGDRTKPWGTGQAVLSCKGIVNEPFVVINADDYYGDEGFKKIYEFLTDEKNSGKKGNYCMAGFVIGNTLSENGVVTRGICKEDENGMLTYVEEGFDLKRDGDMVTGRIEDGTPVKVPLNTPVSMNMWGLTPDFFDVLESGFAEFLNNIAGNPLKAEYLLPGVVGGLVSKNAATVKVLKTNDKWFGVTYHEDKEAVVRSIRELVDAGKYPAKLFD